MSDTDTPRQIAEETPDLAPVSWSDLQGWASDDHLAAFQAFLRTAEPSVERPYETRRLGVSGDRLAAIGKRALTAEISTQQAARLFFEQNFHAHRLIVQSEGHLTGYYEPSVRASRAKTADYAFPILRRPPDLVDLTDENRPTDIEPHIRYGRQMPDGSIASYWDRASIEGNDRHEGILTGQGLELAWVADPMDAYFIHIQGSARLLLTDGMQMRVTYAAKSGHDYSSIGKALHGAGELAADDLTMVSLRRWFQENPERRTEFTWRNRSYIFFEESEIAGPEMGPVAAAKVPLTAGRSMAVDRTLHTYGTPFFVSIASAPDGLDGPDSRLVIAQDTGSAIVGPVRGDLFVGTGDEAGVTAGAINSVADFVVLLPKDPLPSGPVSSEPLRHESLPRGSRR
ncbi:MAG: MltA domain-containing protein [Pseudomonadota bacterium]